mgnify:CR=1 FL=1
MTSDKSKQLDWGEPVKFNENPLDYEIEPEIDWDTICKQVNKERFDPYYTNVYGISLTESKYRRKK